MRSPFTCLLMIAAFSTFLSGNLFAQHNTVEKQTPQLVKKDITFIVRKPDKVKNIAVRFHVPDRLFISLNRPIRKKQMVYAGKKLLIPVWLSRKSTSPRDAEYNLADYQLDIDSLDSYITEDFVSMADIEADSMRRMVIDRDIKKIDKRITSVNVTLDSIEDDARHNLSNRELRKLPMDRARRIGAFKIGTQVDSLTALRKKIIEEKAKIDLRVADYEYLVENAAYSAAHRGQEDQTLIDIKESWDYPTQVRSKKKNKTDK